MKQLVEAHNRVKDLDWTPSYTVKPTKYPTKYVLPKKTKDPFRHLLREYFAMEQEKDNRQYGALEDALSRVDAAAQAEPRWMEVMKIALGFCERGRILCDESDGPVDRDSRQRRVAAGVHGADDGRDSPCQSADLSLALFCQARGRP